MVIRSIGGADCRPIEREIARHRAERDALQDALQNGPGVQQAVIAWRIRRLNARLAQRQALRETFCLADVRRQH